VVQVSSQWQQFLRSLQTSFKSIDWRALLQSLERFRGPGGWLGGLTILVIFLLWNWLLVTATGVGLITMLFVYRLQQNRWQPGWNWQRLWNRSNRQLTLAVAGGGIATLSTYMASMVWIKSDDPWLATGTVLQGLGMLSTLLLLLWQMLNRSSIQETDYYQMLARLDQPDPLKRLIAIRQVTYWANRYTVSDRTIAQMSKDVVTAHLADCFRLMLSQEAEPTIRTALLDGLQLLSRQNLEQIGEPIAIPMVMPQPETQMYCQDD
jgi:hypothetical protein